MYCTFSCLDSSQIGHGINWGFDKSKTLDKLLSAGRYTVSSSKRNQIYAQAQKYIDQQAIWAPIYTEYDYTTLNKKVHGVRISPTAQLLIQDAYVK